MRSSPGCRCPPWWPTHCADFSTIPTQQIRDRPRRRRDVSTAGIEAVFLETHNWGKAAAFWQALGYTLEFDTGHSSGQLRNGDGPYVFIAEVPEDRAPQLQLVLKVPDADALRLDPSVEVVTPFEETHWGAQEMTV